MADDLCGEGNEERNKNIMSQRSTSSRRKATKDNTTHIGDVVGNPLDKLIHC